MLPIICAFLCAVSSGALAQPYPVKPVTIIVPYPAGSSGDVLARVVSDRLTQALGKGFIVDNRPGAAGLPATQVVQRAAPDGYTLLLTGLNHTSNVGLFKALPYDSVGGFTPITLVGSVPVVLVTHKNSGIASYEDLIAKAKRDPGKLNFGSAGIGTGGHLATELMMQTNSIKMTHVPYKGATPALTDLLSGQIDVLFTGVPPTVEHIKAGTLRPLIVSSAAPLPNLPETRTGRDVGMKDFLVDVWFGVLAPVGTPAEVVAILKREIESAVRDPVNAGKLAAQGVLSADFGPEAFAARLKSDLDTWPKVMKAAGLNAE